jgi:SOS-response transcriptional repressor LexA
MLLPLTSVQQNVFDCLAKLFIKESYPPTAREIAAIAGMKTVSGELVALRKKGWAEKVENVHARSTKPTDEAIERFKTVN